MQIYYNYIHLYVRFVSVLYFEKYGIVINYDGDDLDFYRPDRIWTRIKKNILYMELNDWELISPFCDSFFEDDCEKCKFGEKNNFCKEIKLCEISNSSLFEIIEAIEDII